MHQSSSKDADKIPQKSFKNESKKSKLESNQKSNHKFDRGHQLKVETSYGNPLETQNFRQMTIKPQVSTLNNKLQNLSKGKEPMKNQQTICKDSPVPTEQEFIEQLNPSSLKQDLIELKNESAASKVLNKSMIVNGSAGDKQPQPKWGNAKASQMSMQKLHEKLLKFGSNNQDSQKHLMTLLKQIIIVLSQDQRDQLASHMQAKLSCLGSSKDNESTITDQNELQAL